MQDASSETQMAPAPVVHVIQVCRARYSGGKGALDTSISLDEAAHIISVFAVPFAPDIPVGEAAHLVQTATVPGLCYQLDLQPLASYFTVDCMS